MNNTLSCSRHEELLRWWSLSLHAIADSPYVAVSDYAVNKLRNIRFAEKVLENLASRLLACRAKCPKQFRQWCYRQIDKQAAKFIDDKNAAERPQRKRRKAFNCEQHGDVCHVQLNDSEGRQHVWKFPADWREQAEFLWPLHVKRLPSGTFYLARKVATNHIDGKRVQSTRPAHRFFIAWKHPFLTTADLSAIRIHARNGDLLDWSGDNLYVPVVEGNPTSKLQRELAIKKNLQESGRKQVYWEDEYGDSGYVHMPVAIERELLEYWEKRLVDGTLTQRDIMEQATYKSVGNRWIRSYQPLDWIPSPSEDYEGSPVDPCPAKPVRPDGAGPATDDHDESMHTWFDTGFNFEHAHS